MTPDIEFECLAEDALLLRFGRHIDAQINADVHAATACLQRQVPMLECIPAYASVLVRFDPMGWPGEDTQPVHARVQAAVVAALRDDRRALAAPRDIVIPVCYGGEYGPDLSDAAARCGMDVAEVIARHAAAVYRVAMLGFAPGFPYLLGLDPRLALPRRDDPRQRVPAGSVAIGGNQTGVYPAELPGGWRLIGRTPLRLFDAAARNPTLLVAGDQVRFRAIDAAAFDQPSPPATP